MHGHRRLADWLNVTLLRNEMERVGLPGGGEGRSRYDRLTDEDTGTGVADLLRQEGVAADELRDDFVSYSVVRTHLRDCLDEHREAAPASDQEVDRLEQLEADATTGAADAVHSLVNEGKLTAGGDIEPDVTICVTCSDCGLIVPAIDALVLGTFCDCSG